MGCTASKLDNEDTVRRCKERRRLMKEAVYARHHLAAAHSDYLRSLRLTGSALYDFASGEPLSVSDQTPAVLLRNPSSLSYRAPPPPPPPPPPPRSPSPTPPPPRRPYFSHPSPTIASSKLPHILSESSPSSTPRPKPTGKYNFPSNSSFSSTPSQSSSAWNWENFYPPSPPGSDFFQRSKDDDHFSDNHSNHPFSDNHINHPFSDNHSDHHFSDNHSNRHFSDNHSDHHFSDNHSNRHFSDNHSNRHFSENHSNHHFSDNQSNHHFSDNQSNRNRNRHHLDRDDEEYEETEREEVHCSDWGDHYSTTSSDTKSDNGEDDGFRDLRSETGSRSNFGSSVHNDTASKSNLPPMEKLEKSDGAGSSVSWNASTGEVPGLKMVVRHRNLSEIAAAINEYFEKAASAGEPVSDLLETGRAQLDRSFRQLKKTVYHSSSVLSNLSSTWTSKPPLAIKYQLDAGSLNEPGGLKSHCSTLERLFEWEKKLYVEVKAREGANIEREKKLSSLQSQEYKGEEETKLDKTKASIKRLQSMIDVSSQAVSTTSSAIIRVRDTELASQLVELCHGFMYMWRSMNEFHEVQNHIVQQVQGLVHRSAKGESTSDLHRHATRHLESAVSDWHSSFSRLIKYQRDYVRSLHSWLKLTLHAINDGTAGTNDPSRSFQASSDLFAFLDEWKQALDHVPDTVASEAIKSFVNVVHVISVKQSEELKIKKRAETASKELEKKASALRNIEKKFYHSYSMAGIGLPGGGSDGGQVFDARDPLAEKKQELAGCQSRVEDEMSRHTKAVEVTRAMTVNNIQTGLPGVFQAMTAFSGVFTEHLERVCTRSYSIK